MPEDTKWINTYTHTIHTHIPTCNTYMHTDTYTQTYPHPHTCTTSIISASSTCPTNTNLLVCVSKASIRAGGAAQASPARMNIMVSRSESLDVSRAEVTSLKT